MDEKNHEIVATIKILGFRVYVNSFVCFFFHVWLFLLVFFPCIINVSTFTSRNYTSSFTHFLSHYNNYVFSLIPFSFHRFFTRSTRSFFLFIIVQNFSIMAQSFSTLWQSFRHKGCILSS
jgi:hypothetical protein